MRFLRIFVFFICVSSAYSWPSVSFKEKVEVGLQPLAVNFDSKTNLYHIFCNGDDKNYNGKIDEGDTPPSWWTLKYDNNNLIKTKVKEFTNGYFQFPLRVDFLDANDFSDRLVYIPFADETDANFKVTKSGYIQSLSLDDFEVVDDNVCGFKGEAVASYGPHLLIPKNPADGSEGEVIVFNLAIKKPLQTIKAGKMVQEAQAFSDANGKLRLAAFSLGSFGADSSILHIAEVPHTQDFTFTDFKIGKTPNHLAINKGKVVVTLNGSHEVLFKDITKLEVAPTIFKTGTTGFNGPRETVFLEAYNIFLTTTYNGELLWKADYQTEFQRVEASSKNIKAALEGIVAREGIGNVVVASPYDTTYNKENGGVYIFDKLENTSVEEIQTKANDKSLIFPNPVRSKLKLNLSQDDLNAFYSVQITDNTGSVVYSSNEMGYTLANGIAVVSLNLQTNGCYFLTLQSSNNTIISSPFIYLSE